MTQAILYSSHEEVGRIPVDRIHRIYAWTPRRNDEDLIKIVGKYGEEYFCDEIEYQSVTTALID